MPRDLLQEETLTKQWVNGHTIAPTDGSAFNDVVDALRELQDAIAGSRPGAHQAGDVANRIRQITASLAEAQVDEGQQLAGRVFDSPGRALTFVPAHELDAFSSELLRGRVRFGRSHLGGNGAAHGGVIALFFDEVVGWFAAGLKNRVRTAYLHVDYRAVVPIERELSFEVQVLYNQGRKIRLAARLEVEGKLLAEADALYVELRAGQP